MSAPWEKYATASTDAPPDPASGGPWAKYGGAAKEPGALERVAGYVGGKIKDAFEANKEGMTKTAADFAEKQKPAKTVGQSVKNTVGSQADIAGMIGHGLGMATSPVAGLINTVADPLKQATGLDLNQALMGLGPEVGTANIGRAAAGMAPLTPIPAADTTLGRAGNFAARGVNKLAGGKLLDPQASAASRIRQWLRMDGLDPAAVEAEAKRFEEHGITPTLLNVAGENTKAGLRAAASKMGPGRSEAVKLQNTTRANLGPEAQAATRKITPEQRPLHEVRQDLEDTRDRLAEEQYRPAYAQPVQVTPEIIAEIRDKEGVSAINQAMKAARAKKDYAQVKELEGLVKHVGTLESGAHVPEAVANALKDPAVPEAWKAQLRKTAEAAAPPPPMVSGGALDRVRIALGRRGAALSKTGTQDVASGFFDRANKLGSILDEVPHLKEARATYRHLSDQLKAADFSEHVLTQSPEAFGAAIKKMDPKALETLRVVGRQQLTDAMGKSPRAVMSLLDTIAHSPNARQNLMHLYGPAEGAKFADSMELRLRRLQDANDMSARTGSKTQVLKGDQDDTGMGEVAKDVMHAHASPGSFLLSKFLKGATTMSDPEREMLVRMGIGTPVPDVLQQIRNRP